MRICIITPGQIGSNPRVVKEADALVAAGHCVTVICTKVARFVEPRDQSIMARARFSVRRLPFDRPFARWVARVVQIAARYLCRKGLGSRFEPAAHSVFASALTRAAIAEPADLYIAHYVAALPAAAVAAQRHGAAYAFDAEDFHLGDLPDLPQNQFANSLIKRIEKRYLSSATFITAASPMIAAAYAETYGLPLPATVLNVFPRTNGPSAPTAAGSQRPGPTLYWFSQVIGPGRGLEAAVEALALVRVPLQLHLRGSPAAGYEHELRRLAASFGVADRLHLHRPIAPDALELDAARFDLGYAGELPHSLNRTIALTNKLFSYLTSGLPVVLSDIPAHRELAPKLGQAGEMFASGSAASLAAAIERHLAGRQGLAARRAQAWELGQTKFAWDNEAHKIVGLVQACSTRLHVAHHKA